MLNVECCDAYSFNIQHSSSLQFTTTEIRSIKASREEANGVWWLPRSSKPLFRRGSVEGLVRFRRASASKGRRQKAESRSGRPGYFCLLPSAFLPRRGVRQESDFHGPPFVRSVHRFDGAIE